jgi:hypothetical protein
MGRFDLPSDAQPLVDGLFRVCDSLNAELEKSSGVIVLPVA